MSYSTTGVRFDGTNDYMLRGAGFTSAADSQKILCSFWVNFMGGDGVYQQIMEDDQGGSGFQVSRTNANKMYVQLSSSAPAAFYTVTSSTTFNAAAGWKHVMFSFDGTIGTPPFGLDTFCALFVDGALDGSPAFSGGINSDFTRSEWGFANRPTGGLLCNMEVADFWMDFGRSADLSDSAVREKFRSAAGTVVDLGSNGATPYGSTPTIFLKGPAATFPTNLGSGGGFTLTGTLADSATNPPADAAAAEPTLTQSLVAHVIGSTRTIGY